MPLIDDDPPITRPLGQLWRCRATALSGSKSTQLCRPLRSNFPVQIGIRIKGFGRDRLPPEAGRALSDPPTAWMTIRSRQSHLPPQCERIVLPPHSTLHAAECFVRSSLCRQTCRTCDIIRSNPMTRRHDQRKAPVNCYPGNAESSTPCIYDGACAQRDFKSTKPHKNEVGLFRDVRKLQLARRQSADIA
ncbi:hypothetical protein ACVWXM_009572 [Bradyrhizobium sp. GM7.3]